jgi:biopolymer transport protein ExbD
MAQHNPDPTGGMKILSPLPTRRGRLEIIPLIDIMFFLLAAFMLVSINKIRVKSLKVNLPTNVPTAQIEKKEDFTSVSVNADGQVQIDKELITDKQEVLPKLQALYAQNKDQKFLISADKNARNGDVIAVLGALRSAGFQKVAFSISSISGTVGASTPSSAPAAGTPPNLPALTPVSPVPASLLTPPSESSAAHP